jgi:membrane-associated HD superfamily phosphohydrolase
LPSKLPENLPDVIDRTDKTDPLQESSFGDSNIVWIVLILCVTAIIVILLIVTRDEKRKKAAAKMAKTGFKQTKNIAIKIVRPVWRRYTVPLATIILGLALLLGISILQLLPFRLLPLYIEVIMMVIGFLLIVLGTFSLISSTIFGSKKDKIITLSDFVKERKEKKEK